MKLIPYPNDGIADSYGAYIDSDDGHFSMQIDNPYGLSCSVDEWETGCRESFELAEKICNAYNHNDGLAWALELLIHHMERFDELQEFDSPAEDALNNARAALQKANGDEK